MAIVDLLSRDWGVDAHRDGGKAWAEFDLVTASQSARGSRTA
jgi:hypothetical protein